MATGMLKMSFTWPKRVVNNDLQDRVISTSCSLVFTEEGKHIPDHDPQYGRERVHPPMGFSGVPSGAF